MISTVRRTTRTAGISGAGWAIATGMMGRLPDGAEVQRRWCLGMAPIPSMPGPGVGREHGPDLAHEHRLAAEHLAAALHQPRGLVLGRDVLDHPGVGAGLVALAAVVQQPLERARAGAHALHGRQLALQREDRLDLQRRSDPGAGRADPPAALEELQRVHGEPDLEVGARLLGAPLDPSASSPAAAAAAAREHHQPQPARGGLRVHHAHPLAALALALELLRRLAGRVRRAGDARPRCGPRPPRCPPPAAARTRR